METPVYHPVTNMLHAPSAPKVCFASVVSCFANDLLIYAATRPCLEFHINETLQFEDSGNGNAFFAGTYHAEPSRIINELMDQSILWDWARYEKKRAKDNGKKITAVNHAQQNFIHLFHKQQGSFDNRASLLLPHPSCVERQNSPCQTSPNSAAHYDSALCCLKRPHVHSTQDSQK